MNPYEIPSEAEILAQAKAKTGKTVKTAAMQPNVFSLSREDLAAWAKETWGVRIGLGWLVLKLTTTESQQLTADMLDCLPHSFRAVPGTTYHRPSGKLYTWGGTLYAGDDAELPPLLVLPDRAIRTIERVEGPITEVGGGGYFRAMAANGAESTRCDVFTDWYGQEIDPVIDAAVALDYSPWKLAPEFRNSRGKERGGVTIYFGNHRAGTSFVRCYEKGGEQGEAFPITRFEYEAHNDHATALYRAIATNPDARAGMASVWPSRLDFRIGYGQALEEKNTQAMRDTLRWGWYQQMLNQLPQAEPFDPHCTRVTDIEKFLKWVKTIMPRTLNKIELCLGQEQADNWLSALKTEGVIDEKEALQIKLWRESRSPGIAGFETEDTTHGDT